MTIESRDISVVVQGPVDWGVNAKFSRPTTLSLTRAIRRLLPDSEIILSSWADQKVDGLHFDHLLLSEDPGPQGVWPSFTPNNVNRQIRSTVAGLKQVATPYCLKIRADVILLNTAFVDAFCSLDPIHGPEAIFEYPIVANNLTSRNAAAILQRLPDNPILFHPSDHVHFGKTSDLRRLWDVPLQTDEDSFHFMDRIQPNRWRAHEFSRLAPEQHLFVSALGGRLGGGLRHYADTSPELVDKNNYYMNTHFHFLRDDVFMYFEKYNSDHHRSFEWMRLNHGAEAPPVREASSWIQKAYRIAKLP